MDKIKVIGIGCSGINITNRLRERNFENFIYSVIAADKKLLEQSLADEKLFIDNNLGGYGGFCGNAKNAENSAIKYQKEIKNFISGSKSVVIISALGGGTGSGIAPFVVKMAKEMNIIDFTIVIKPFDFEGDNRRNSAQTTINKIKSTTNNLYTLENQSIYEQTKNKNSISDAFKIIDDEIVKILTKLIETENFV